jgi:hypothetical protein
VNKDLKAVVGPYSIFQIGIAQRFAPSVEMRRVQFLGSQLSLRGSLAQESFKFHANKVPRVFLMAHRYCDEAKDVRSPQRSAIKPQTVRVAVSCEPAKQRQNAIDQQRILVLLAPAVDVESESDSLFFSHKIMPHA